MGKSVTITSPNDLKDWKKEFNISWHAVMLQLSWLQTAMWHCTWKHAHDFVKVIFFRMKYLKVCVVGYWIWGVRTSLFAPVCVFSGPYCGKTVVENNIRGGPSRQCDRNTKAWSHRQSHTGGGVRQGYNILFRLGYSLGLEIESQFYFRTSSKFPWTVDLDSITRTYGFRFRSKALTQKAGSHIL